MVRPSASLCQIVAVRARMRWAIRGQTPGTGRPPWGWRSSWPFRVSLIDSMTWRSRLEEPFVGSGGFASAGRAEQGDTGVGQVGLEGLAVVVLVPDHGLSSPGGDGGGDRDGGEDVVQGV